MILPTLYIEIDGLIVIAEPGHTYQVVWLVDVLQRLDVLEEAAEVRRQVLQQQAVVVPLLHQSHLNDNMDYHSTKWNTK